MSTHNHKCTLTCWKRLQEENVFARQGVKYKATGMVFVCQESLRVHVCGVGRCLNYKIMPNGEGATCELTGLWLDSEYSANTNWYEPDVRCVGHHTFVHNTQHIVEAKLDKISELSGLGASTLASAEDEDADGFMANTRDFFKQAESVHMYASGFTQSKPPKVVPRNATKKYKNKSFDDAIMSMGTEQDRQRVMARHQGASELEILRQIELAMKRKEVIQSVWMTHTVSDLYIDEAIRVGKEASDKWLQMCSNYVKEYQDKGVMWNKHKLMFLWLRYVAPHMKNVPMGRAIVEANNKYKDYYVECMLRIWDMFQDVTVVKNGLVTFSSCAPSLLTKLSQGLVQTVYFLPGNPKPYIKDTFNEHHLTEASRVDIEFIPKHSCLVLASTSEVRKLSPLISTQKKVGQHSKSAAGNRLMESRKVGGHSKCRRTRKPAGIMPSTKYLNKIYFCIIESAESLDDLNKYVFKHDT